jgi:hypothetical protein
MVFPAFCPCSAGAGGLDGGQIGRFRAYEQAQALDLGG